MDNQVAMDKFASTIILLKRTNNTPTFIFRNETNFKQKYSLLIVHFINLSIVFCLTIASNKFIYISLNVFGISGTSHY